MSMSCLRIRSSSRSSGPSYTCETMTVNGEALGSPSLASSLMNGFEGCCDTAISAAKAAGSSTVTGSSAEASERLRAPPLRHQAKRLSPSRRAQRRFPNLADSIPLIFDCLIDYLSINVLGERFRALANGRALLGKFLSAGSAASEDNFFSDSDQPRQVAADSTGLFFLILQQLAFGDSINSLRHRGNRLRRRILASWQLPPAAPLRQQIHFHVSRRFVTCSKP